MSVNPHRIEVTIAPGGYVRAVMKCDAPVGAPCRLWCLHDCETAHDDHELYHHLVDQGCCVQIDGWFDDDPFDAYTGVEAPLRSGPVVLVWEGDYFTWRYDEGEGAQS